MAGRWYQEELPLAGPGLPPGEVEDTQHWWDDGPLYGPTEPKRWSAFSYETGIFGILTHYKYRPFKVKK